jgi:hypothetical protein
LENRQVDDQLNHPALTLIAARPHDGMAVELPSLSSRGGRQCNCRPNLQLDHPALTLIAARPELFCRQGNVAATYRRRNGKTFGPYYRLSYREDGQQRSIYLGRSGPLVEQVRQTLAAYQQPITQHRLCERLMGQVRASLRVEKLRVRALLCPFGLRLKGFEVRGWRFSPLRWLLPRRRRLAPPFAMRIPRLRPRPNDDPASRLHRYLAARDGYVPCDDATLTLASFQSRNQRIGPMASSSRPSFMFCADRPPIHRRPRP